MSISNLFQRNAIYRLKHGDIGVADSSSVAKTEIEKQSDTGIADSSDIAKTEIEKDKFVRIWKKKSEVLQIISKIFPERKSINVQVKGGDFLVYLNSCYQICIGHPGKLVQISSFNNQIRILWGREKFSADTIKQVILQTYDVLLEQLPRKEDLTQTRERDLFIKRWSSRADGKQILQGLIKTSAIVSTEKNKTFRVKGDGLKCIGLHNLAIEGVERDVEGEIYVILRKDGRIDLLWNTVDNGVVSADVLENLLLEAYAKALVPIQLENDPCQKYAQFAKLIFFKMKSHEKQLPYGLDDFRMMFEGFRYRVQVILRKSLFISDAARGFSEERFKLHPSVEFIGEKEGAEDKRISFFLCSKKPIVKVDSSGNRSFFTYYSYVLKVKDFHSDVGEFISTFYDRAFRDYSSKLADCVKREIQRDENGAVYQAHVSK
jgi:hypothetical protein